MTTDQSKHGNTVTFADSWPDYFYPHSVLLGGCTVSGFKELWLGMEVGWKCFFALLLMVILGMWTWLRFVELTLTDYCV